MIDVCEGLSADGILVINSRKAPAEVKRELGRTAGKVAVIDATGIALKELKRNLPNTPLIGALVRAAGFLRLEDVLAGFKKQYSGKFTAEVVEANLRAMKTAYDEVKIG
jgi:pyruvate ferredoxin oxidoreductase gamma subunit